MKTVLVVDSDTTSRQNLISGLARLENECRVLEAGNGVEAMEILSTRPVDVVATELDMPVMDGFELSVYILEHHPSVEIIVLGTEDSGRVGQALTAQGAFRYLPKPHAAESLVDVIRQLTPAATRGPIEGLSLAGFLQLLNSETRSCSLKVEAQSGMGRIDLVEGEIFDAVAGELRGRRALYSLLALEDPQLEAEEPGSEVDRTINAALPRLLLEAAFWQDQFLGEGPLRPEAPVPGEESLRIVSGENPTEEPSASVEIRRGLLALLGLDGAIGAAVVDMDRSTCFLHASLDPRFAETAVRAGQIAKHRLKAMADGSRYHVLQMKLPSPDRFGLLRLVRSKPNLVLYFAGELDRTDPDKAGALLADVEHLFAAHSGALPAS
ncbi:MAG: response regulator [bacterium]|nr:response regulator [bacterium]